jgi:hypothetical protein
MKYIIYYLFFSLIIIFFAYINSMYISNSSTENFTPKIREIYRPYVRNISIFGKGFINKSKIQISNIFRKFGIL